MKELNRVLTECGMRKLRETLVFNPIMKVGTEIGFVGIFSVCLRTKGK